LEFAGHRSYVPGDDLRWLDQRALLRHGRPLVKQFETETERSLRLGVDASASMGFRSEGAPCSKLEFAALLAAALARVTVRSGDPVGLDFFAGRVARGLATSGGLQAFERVVVELSRVEAHGRLEAGRPALERALGPLVHRAARGSVLVLLSDLLDFGEEGPEAIAALGTGGRQVVVVQVLDPVEATFPVEGPVRLRSAENDMEIETNASVARAGYLEAMAALQDRFRQALRMHGGGLVVCRTDADPIVVVRSVLWAAMGRVP
jgi:uncharacterized protein (DUF58 family)